MDMVELEQPQVLDGVVEREQIVVLALVVIVVA